MKNQLLSVKKLCKDHLSSKITVDFVPFDSELFRLSKGITKAKEDEIIHLKHPMHNQLHIPEQDAIVKKVFSDTEYYKKIPEQERTTYATIFSMGICMEESLQRLQDACIKTNVLFDNTNMWMSIDLEKCKELRKAGLMDDFDIPVVPKNAEEAVLFMKRLDAIFASE